jgi:hypothetical protein
MLSSDPKSENALRLGSSSAREPIVSRLYAGPTQIREGHWEVLAALTAQRRAEQLRNRPIEAWQQFCLPL